MTWEPDAVYVLSVVSFIAGLGLAVILFGP